MKAYEARLEGGTIDRNFKEGVRGKLDDEISPQLDEKYSKKFIGLLLVILFGDRLYFDLIKPLMNWFSSSAEELDEEGLEEDYEELDEELDEDYNEGDDFF